MDVKLCDWQFIYSFLTASFKCSVNRVAIINPRKKPNPKIVIKNDKSIDGKN